ncbi:unnamed protein product [Closterium sp. Yama58-4]|nr:unnamed protein product [Closterium sp. Yama58-4]
MGFARSYRRIVARVAPLSRTPLGPETVTPLLCDWIARHGTVFGFAAGPQPALVLADPDLVQQVLIGRSGFFQKMPAVQRALSFVGDGLPFVDGEEWLRQRKAVNPSFSHGAIKLKDMHMVLLETLRLFPPVPVVTRTSKQDVRIGPYVIPKGVDLFLPVGCLHADERYWGADAREFNPERFQDGQQAACSHPQAFIPFSSGPRDCVGAMFGLTEAKIILSHLLLNVSWSISPSYRHQPTAALTAQAKHGMPLLFKALSPLAPSHFPPSPAHSPPSSSRFPPFSLSFPPLLPLIFPLSSSHSPPLPLISPLVPLIFPPAHPHFPPFSLFISPSPSPHFPLSVYSFLPLLSHISLLRPLLSPSPSPPSPSPSPHSPLFPLISPSPYPHFPLSFPSFRPPSPHFALLPLIHPFLTLISPCVP